MTQEINLSLHLSVHAVVIDLPHGPRIENFSRLLASYLMNVNTCQTRILLRVELPSNFQEAEAVYEKFLEFKQLTAHCVH